MTTLARVTSVAPPALTDEDRAVQIAAIWVLEYKSENTRKAYLADLRDFENWCRAQGIGLLDVTRVNVTAYCFHLQRLGRKPATVERKIKSLVSYFEFLVDEGLMRVNPATKVRTPRKSKDLWGVALTEEQGAALIAEAKRESPEAHLMAALLLAMGLRVTEACEITKADLAIRDGYRVVTLTRKGDYQQTLSIPVEVWKILEPVAEAAPGDEILPYNRHTAAYLLKKLTARNPIFQGLPKQITPHDLRHTFATRALDRGVPLHHVQEYLGHQDPKTTQRYNNERNNPKNSPALVLAPLFLAPATA